MKTEKDTDRLADCAKVHEAFAANIPEAGEEIELKQVYAIFDMSEETFWIEINAQILLNGELRKVSSVMDFDDIKHAFYEVREGYCPGIMQYEWDEVDNYEPVRDHIVLSIPEDTVTLTLQTKLMVGDEPKNMEYFYGVKKVREAIEKAEKDYIPSDAVFVATDKGKELIAQMEKEGKL